MGTSVSSLFSRQDHSGFPETDEWTSPRAASPTLAFAANSNRAPVSSPASWKLDVSSSYMHSICYMKIISKERTRELRSQRCYLFTVAQTGIEIDTGSEVGMDSHPTWRPTNLAI